MCAFNCLLLFFILFISLLNSISFYCFASVMYISLYLLFTVVVQVSETNVFVCVRWKLKFISNLFSVPISFSVSQKVLGDQMILIYGFCPLPLLSVILSVLRCILFSLLYYYVLVHWHKFIY